MSERNMSEQAKEARRAYKREWGRRNADKVRLYQERFFAKKAAEMAQQDQRKQQTESD